jgi:uncharacterized membrane protein YozB (DUF420 family)
MAAHSSVSVVLAAPRYGGCVRPAAGAHAILGPIAKLHRVVGRTYVGGVLVAAPLGLYIQYFAERSGAPRSFSVAAATQATTWIVTTVIALAFILQGKVEQHRRWMTRSFSVALVFLEVRLVLGVTGWEHLGVSAAETVVWACNVFALLSADLVLQWQELRRPHPRYS